MIAGWISDFTDTPAYRELPPAAKEYAETILPAFLKRACAEREVPPAEIEESDLKPALLEGVGGLDLPASVRAVVPDLCRAQIDRVQAIWSDCRERYGHRGPWLFGDFGIADVMFVPVALRFVSYGIPVEDRAAEFLRATLALPSVQEWIHASEAEGLPLAFVDELGEGDMILG